MCNTWLGRRGTCSGTHSVETRHRQRWPSVKPGPGKRDHDGVSTDGVERVTSRAKTRSTRPTAGDPTSERRQLVRQEEAATRHSHSRWRCVDDVRLTNLTPSHRHDGDARERQHVSPYTDNSSRHTVQQRHTLGRQRVSSPVRQLRLTLGLTVSRPYTPSDSHSDSQSDNSVDDYWVTLIHPLMSASRYTVSRLHDHLTVY